MIASTTPSPQMDSKLSFSKRTLDDLITPTLQMENGVFTYMAGTDIYIRFGRFLKPNRRGRVHFGDQLSSKKLGFAHIGPFEDALKGLFGKNVDMLEPWGALEGLAQEVVKKTEALLGLGKRPVSLELSSWTPGKGETLAVLVSVHPQRGLLEEISSFVRRKPQQEPEVHVVYAGSEIPVFPTATDNGLWRALVPTTPLDTPGSRTLKGTVSHCNHNCQKAIAEAMSILLERIEEKVEVADGRHESFEGLVEVTNKEYPVESIWLTKTKSKIRGTVMEKQRVATLVSTVSEEQIWRGPFILPSDGEITTGYGLQRYYNGVFAEKYYHRGVDYGAYEGDPVKAPANGRVVLVGKEKDGFEIHGNCVGLDHGQGVTSILMHLNSSFVKEGEIVQSGQIIGTVGETGIATGPHLHWGLYVQGEAVDPHPWMQKQKWV